MTARALQRTLMRSLAIAMLAAACTPIVHPAPPVPMPDARAAQDPVHTGEVMALHVAAEHTLHALVGALDADQRAKVAGVTLGFDTAQGEVNAYATCNGAGQPIIAISDGLLEIARQLAVARAFDDTYGTDRVATYTRWIAKHPGKTFAADLADGRTLQLARVLFVEELAYVIGHELGHHYLGHLGCLEGGGTIEQLGRMAANAVPLFSQAAELAADAAGVANTLEVGRTTGWTEAGAVLMLQFFRSEQSWQEIVFAFEQSHPLSELRLPTVTATADLWRATAAVR
jgi:Zn-dependent protease with chaperone function